MTEIIQLTKKQINKNLPKFIGKSINTIAYFAPEKAAKLALDLFCTPRAGKLKEYQLNFLNKAEWVSLQAGDKKFQTYHWAGLGPTVILLHGWQNNSWRWRKLINQLLMSGFSVVAIDAPAHGASDGKTFNAHDFAVNLEVAMKHFQPTYLIGHSIGAFTAIYYYTHFKAVPLKKMVCIASPDKLTTLTETFKNILGFNEKVMEVYNKAFTNFFPEDQTYYNASDFVKKIQIPGLIIHDENDELNPFEGGQAIAKNWKNSQFISTQNLRHATQSDEVSAAIIQFLKEEVYE